MFEQLNTLCAQVGYRFDALLSEPDRYLCVLADTLGGELVFSGNTPEAAVEAAISRLAELTGKVAHWARLMQLG